jgi:hypothetical protein
MKPEKNEFWGATFVLGTHGCSNVEDTTEWFYVPISLLHNGSFPYATYP